METYTYLTLMIIKWYLSFPNKLFQSTLSFIYKIDIIIQNITWTDIGCFKDNIQTSQRLIHN